MGGELWKLNLAWQPQKCEKGLFLKKSSHLKAWRWESPKTMVIK